MVLKGASSFLGGSVTGVRFFADELFFDGNIVFEFQCFGMAGQISVGNAQKFFQRTEIGRFIHHQNRHDSQSYSMIECFVDILDDVFQNYFLSYL